MGNKQTTFSEEQLENYVVTIRSTSFAIVLL